MEWSISYTRRIRMRLNHDVYIRSWYIHPVRTNETNYDNYLLMQA